MVPARERLWRYAKTTGWLPANPVRPHLTFEEILSRRIGRTPPCSWPDATSVAAVYDQLGVCWFTSQGRLFKAWDKTVQEMLPQAMHPFRDGRAPGEAVADGTGNIFLSIPAGQRSVPHEYVFVAAPHAPPRIQVRLEQPGLMKQGLAKLICEETATGRVEFTWRADGGIWHRPQSGGELVLAGLPPGEHRIEALAMDGATLCAAQPTQLVAQIKTSVAVQAAWLLERSLSTTNQEERQEAFSGLLALGSESLPEVQRALAKATDAQWPLLKALEQQLEHEQQGRASETVHWLPVNAAACSRHTGISSWISRIQGRFVHDWE